MDVLLGVEGSEESRRALESTIERALEAGDDLTIAVFAKQGQSLDEIERRVEEALQRAGLTAEVVRIERDNPASRLVELAETGEFDRLAIGGGQRSPMGKIELGPITEYVLLNARVSVRLER